MKISFFIISLTILLLFSCNKEDLDDTQESMIWEIDNIEGNVEFDKLSSENEAFYFSSTDFFLSGEGSFDLICENQDIYFGYLSKGYTGYFFSEPEERYEADEEWLHATIEGRKIHVVFNNVPQDFHKIITIEVSNNMTPQVKGFNFIRREDYGAEGKWAPMEFELRTESENVLMNLIHIYGTDIELHGECEFELVCTNYDQVWLLPGYFTLDPLEDVYKFDYDWCHFTIQDNIIHCVMEEFNPESDKSGIWVDISAGEMSNSIFFYQDYEINI